MSDKGYLRVTLKVRDEWHFREIVKIAAKKEGESVNGFMIRAIRDAVQKKGIEFPMDILESDKAE